MNLRWTSPHPLFSGMVRYIDKTKYVTKNNRLSASLKKSPCLKIIDHFTNLEIYFLIAVFRNLKIWTMHYKHWCCWLLLIWLKMVFPAVKTSWFIAFPLNPECSMHSSTEARGSSFNMKKSLIDAWFGGS